LPHCGQCAAQRSGFVCADACSTKCTSALSLLAGVPTWSSGVDHQPVAQFTSRTCMVHSVRPSSAVRTHEFFFASRCSTRHDPWCRPDPCADSASWTWLTVWGSLDVPEVVPSQRVHFPQTRHLCMFLFISSAYIQGSYGLLRCVVSNALNNFDRAAECPAMSRRFSELVSPVAKRAGFHKSR